MVMTLAEMKRAVEKGGDAMEQAAKEVLRYGTFFKDKQWEMTAQESARYAGFHRVRTVHYLGVTWRHAMHNGALVSLGYTEPAPQSGE